jgi:hypothetical protein
VLASLPAAPPPATARSSAVAGSDYSDSAHPPALSGVESKACTLSPQLQLLLNNICFIDMKAANLSGSHPLDLVYSSLHCSIQPLEAGPLLDMLRKSLVINQCFLYFFSR